MRRKKSSESETLKAMAPAYDLRRPPSWQNGVIFASAHSGSVYPKSFLKACTLSLQALRKNEDCYVDELFSSAVACGAPLLSARFPRCFVDPNRAPDELPAAWLPSGTSSTARAEIGLGVVPHVISQNRPIYAAPITAEQAQARIDALYHPYHAQLRALIAEAQAADGSALLIDCHSMPGFSTTGDRRPDIILGDRYGTSCYPDTLARIEALFTQRGYSVVRNHPYAGGYVTSHYGHPDQGVEVLQIEINRELYLNGVTLKKNRAYRRLKENLDDIIADIIAGFDQSVALAAQ